MNIVDAHQHYWLTSRTDYGWLQPALGRIYADYMPEQLKPHLERFGIARTILVQAAPSVAETAFMLEIAEREETVAGVVGWLDFESDDFEAEWRRLRRHPKFVGLRPMIQDLPSDWLLRDAVVRHVGLLAEAGFPLDLQANPRHLPYIAQLLGRVPRLRGVIDHMAKPDKTPDDIPAWQAHMSAIAAYPGIMCKLSGMVPEQLDAPWSPADIRPRAEFVIRAFGKRRVMFGSDWPVCLFSATYEQVFALFASCLGDDWTEQEKADAYGRNAARFYHI